jgi:uncharacterized membrane protein (UPF0127 family)
VKLFGNTSITGRRTALLVFSLLTAVVVFILLPARVALSVAHDPECPRWRSAFLTMPTRTLVIQASAIRRIPISVKLAATGEARWAGFQCATRDEIQTTVIVFDFRTEVQGKFHMRNVRAPLDIAFAKESGRIFSTLRMRPSPAKEYGPPGPFRYAIEARAGFFEENGILVGYSLVLEPSE